MKYKDFTFKYFRGEFNNPYIGTSENAAKWWEGEKLFYETISGEGGDEFLENLGKWFDKADAEGGLLGRLKDKAAPRNERLLVFYLDLWHGKAYQYESYDEIEKY